MLIQQQILRITYLSLYQLFRNTWLMVIPLIVAPILAFVVAMNGQKMYLSHATILIEESALLNPFLDELEFSFELKDRMEALRTLVVSRRTLQEIAQAAKLIDDTTSEEFKYELEKKLSEGISISLVGEQLVRIQLKWHKQDEVKVILEQVVEKFIERLLAPTKTSLDNSEQFLSQQLEAMRIELEQAEIVVAKFKAENANSLPNLFGSNQEAMEELERQTQQKQVMLNGAKARLDALSKRVGNANPVLGVLEEKILTLESEIAVLRTKYTDKHSKLSTKIRALGNLKERQKDILAQAPELDVSNMDKLWQMAHRLPADAGNEENSLLVSQLIALQEASNRVDEYSKELQILDEQKQALSVRLLATTDSEKALRKLERDYDVKKRLYSEMLGRYEMAKVSGRLVSYEGPDKVKLIERAYAPNTPINHSPALAAIIGVVIGIICGVAALFVAYLLDNRIKDRVAVERLVGNAPILALPVLAANTLDYEIQSKQINLERLGE